MAPTRSRTFFDPSIGLFDCLRVLLRSAPSLSEHVFVQSHPDRRLPFATTYFCVASLRSLNSADAALFFFLSSIRFVPCFLSASVGHFLPFPPSSPASCTLSRYQRFSCGPNGWMRCLDGHLVHLDSVCPCHAVLRLPFPHAFPKEPSRYDRMIRPSSEKMGGSLAPFVFVATL
ncbi:hypothetical protein HPB50_009029 [Hyalomma asiaticum]|uniref:Uncharacterized protein n=1 Tax=Hyalomma asiaticum TaxID=266040 RepID=A0ACB7ST80_HYAAI|nr:hypothetical protein HPB50_009029 [Hyalomma asiaticum]